jgi:membrane protein implicated in regulation of membrane protease activity
MFRGIAILAGFVLMLGGGIATFITWSAQNVENWDWNGYTILAIVGLLILAGDVWFDWRKEKAARATRTYGRPRFESDVDHMGGV